MKLVKQVKKFFQDEFDKQFVLGPMFAFAFTQLLFTAFDKLLTPFQSALTIMALTLVLGIFWHRFNQYLNL